MSSTSCILDSVVQDFESFLRKYLELRKPSFSYEGLSELQKSIEYTLFSPCKRFRPIVSFGVCEVLDIPYAQTFPLSSALELVHTASLIHDDLPCIDDDVQRRGKKSNHLVFKEDLALIAGDALLIEAFYLLSYYKQKVSIIKCVAKASSMSGMIGGQSLDLRIEKNLDFKFLKLLYKMKTGALIQASVEGVFLLKEDLDESTKKSLLKFGEYLGLAFQLADDLQSPNLEEPLFKLMTKNQAKSLLQEWSEEALKTLQGFSSSSSLVQLIQLNQKRIDH